MKSLDKVKELGKKWIEKIEKLSGNPVKMEFDKKQAKKAL